MKRKWRNLEARLLRLKEEYVNGIRNLEDYWNAVCNCVVSFCNIFTAGYFFSELTIQKSNSVFGLPKADKNASALTMI
jgi:DNA-binding ferritin-like protein (Dps family)